MSKNKEPKDDYLELPEKESGRYGFDRIVNHGGVFNIVASLLDPEKMDDFNKEAILRILTYLTPRQQEVMNLRLGIGVEYPLRLTDIATHLQCSQANVSKSKKQHSKR